MSRMTHTLSIGSTRFELNSQGITYSWPQLYGVLCLLGLVLMSAFGVVYIKDLERRLFIQYQQLQRIEQQAQIDRGKLLLERSTLSAQARIQVMAQQLHMVMPSRKHIVIISDSSNNPGVF